MSYYPYDLIYPELQEETSLTIASSQAQKKQKLESDEESFTDETSVPSDEFDSSYNSDETEEELFELCFYNENNELVYDDIKMVPEKADVENIYPSKKFPEESFLDYCDSSHEMNSSQGSLYESFQDIAGNDMKWPQEIRDSSTIDLVENENEDSQNQGNANKHSLLYILGSNQLLNSCQ